ncbi:MAG: carbohydrate ABC transporter substrate-binding protein [Deltaproteobacteria bacterium]|nr:carbohydrate ABC transporter substrate-binding protein [Deltaproteobacteria bacterium]
MRKLSMFLVIFGLLSWFILSCDEEKSDGADTETVGDKEIEIFSWWTSGGEAEALQALIDAFTAQFPGVNAVNVSAESADGQAARAALDLRMENNNPPDTFQLGPRDFQNWIEYKGNPADNRLEPLDSLFASEGWLTAYPPGVLEVLKYNGSFYAVPVNMHRQNTLMYNMALVPTPPTTWAEFMTLAESLHAQNIVPLAVSAEAGWTLEIIFFSIMAASQGSTYHNAFFTGALDMTDAVNLAKFEAALADYQTLMSYANADAGDLGWDAAAALIKEGSAAMYIHGDWAKGYLESLAWTPGVDFGVMAVPGSQDEFIYNVDTFALCKGAKHRQNALNFLRVIGGPTAQEAFNKLKGSTPVHSDVNVSTWDVAAKSTVADYSNATILHNVEIHQFSVVDATAADGATSLGDKLFELSSGVITEAELVTWVTTNYTLATN